MMALKDATGLSDAESTAGRKGSRAANHASARPPGRGAAMTGRLGRWGGGRATQQAANSCTCPLAPMRE